MLALLVTQALAGCDPSGIDAVVDALSHLPSEHHAMMSAAGLAEACTTPRGVVEAARTLPAMPPDMRQIIDLKAATDSPAAWMAVCTESTEGLRILATMAQLPRGQQRDHLWSGCGLDTLGWFTQEEWRDADGSIVVALAGANEAAQSGISDSKVRTLARGLAGVGGAQGAPRDGSLEDRFLDVPELPMLAPYEPGGGAGLGGGGSAEGLEYLLGLGQEERTEGAASFHRRVEPGWSKKALKTGGRCTVKVFVSKQGALRDLQYVDCPKALQNDVKEAVEASELSPRRKEGANAPGRFTATFSVD